MLYKNIDLLDCLEGSGLLVPAAGGGLGYQIKLVLHGEEVEIFHF